MTCIQKELVDLGYPGISPNGKINAATKAAVEAFRAKNSSNRAVVTIPKLSDKTAVSWCREIASVHPELRRNMPAATAAIVMAENGNSSIQWAMLNQAFQETQTFFRRNYGIYTASRVDVAGADSGTELAKLAVQLQRTRGRSFGRMSTTVSRICKTPSLGYGGQAFRDQLLICWPAVGNQNTAWRNKVSPIVTSIMVHEYMHHIQRELANDKFTNRRTTQRRGKRGPAWMVEGSAELVEYRWGASRHSKFRRTFAQLQKEARESPKSLRAMSEYRSVKGYKQYRIARFATYLLAERFGDKSLFDYWRFIGQGHKWDRAFQLSFGMSLASYQTLFDTLRVDPARAQAFAAGK